MAGSCSRTISVSVSNHIVQDLSGFELVNGTAPYEFIDKTIIGTSVSGSPNSFLATKKRYSDFIIEFDVLVDEGLNSGVQIRSNSLADYRDGRVHGYQVEIDTSPRGWSGGIYDEARRGWLYPLSLNTPGQSAFKNGEWNHYRIVAIGPTILTWINDIPCAHLIDDMTSEGFIAFQVHAIYNKEDEGKKVRWKNIVITELEGVNAIENKPRAPEESYLEGRLTKEEQEAGWQISDQINQQFSETDAFELKVDFQLEGDAEANLTYGEGLQYYLVSGKTDEINVGSLNTQHQSSNLSENNNPSLRYKGGVNWNRGHIILKGDKIEHWLNGIKVLEHHGEQFSSQGFSLTDVKGKVDYKNVKWRVL